MSELARAAGQSDRGREYRPVLRAALVGVLGLTFGVDTAYALAPYGRASRGTLPRTLH